MPILFDDHPLAAYHHFYLADAARNFELPTNGTDEALNTRFLAGTSVIVAATERNMTVPAPHEQRPQIDIDAADHVVVGRIHTSGEIAIAGLSDYFSHVARAVVEAGYLGVMIVSTCLDTRGEEGLDGEDRYEVH